MKKFPILILIPHSSVFVPNQIKQKMLISDFDIKNHSDIATEEIFNIKNAQIIKSKISRLVVDVNRAPDDLEMECRLCVDGAVVRTTPDGKKIYKSPPSINEINKRIETYHYNFHNKVENIIKKENIKFIIDGHSMWSIRPSELKGPSSKRPDICIGNRDFTSCTRQQTYFIKNFLESLNYSIVINIPYKGKYDLGYHCHRRNLPGIQIEINRKLYLNEKTLTVNKKIIKKLNKEMEELTEKIYNKFL